MAKQNGLSWQQVKALLRAGVKDTHGDGHCLYLEVYGVDKGSWVYRGRVRGTGRPARITLGDATSVSLSEARLLADKARAELAQGVHPNEEKRRLIREAKEDELKRTLTFRHVSEEWFNAEAARNAERTQKSIRQRLEKYVYPVIGDRAFADIEFSDLRSCIKPIEEADHLVSARRTALIINQICRFAKRMQYAKYNIADELSATVKKRPNRGDYHFPAIVDEKGVAEMLRDLNAYCQTHRSSIYMETALLLAPYVALRAEEFLKSEWQHVDFENKVWRVPADNTKKNRVHIIPITRQIEALLRRLQGIGRPGYIFRSGRKAGYLTGEGVNAALHLAIGRKGEMTHHGWRKILGTRAREAGAPDKLVEKALAHLLGDATSRAYDFSEYTEARLVFMQWWCDYLDALRDGLPAPAVPLEILNRFA